VKRFKEEARSDLHENNSSSNLDNELEQKKKKKENGSRRATREVNYDINER